MLSQIHLPIKKLLRYWHLLADAVFSVLIYVISRLVLLDRVENSQNIFVQYKNRPVFVVGSGPSLDQVDLKRIRNSNIVLLNNAYKLWPVFSPSNNIFLLFQDTKTFNMIHTSLPAHLPIVFIHSINWLSISLLCFLRRRPMLYILKTEALFLPFAKLCSKKYSYVSGYRYGLFLNRITRPQTFENKFQDNLTMAWASPWTVMLAAVHLLHRQGFHNIISLGFDASYFAGQPHASTLKVEQRYIDSFGLGLNSHTSTPSPCRKVYGLSSRQPTHLCDYKNLHGINVWSGCLYKFLLRNQTRWVNSSPLSYVDTIPNLPFDEIVSNP